MRISRSGSKMIFSAPHNTQQPSPAGRITCDSEIKLHFRAIWGANLAQHQIGAAAICAADKSPQINHIKNTTSFPSKVADFGRRQFVHGCAPTGARSVINDGLLTEERPSASRRRAWYVHGG